MKSYQMINTVVDRPAIALVEQVCTKLASLGLVIIYAQSGRPPTITVQPNAATRKLRAVCTGQGWAEGRMYRSYAVVVDGVKIVWRKPMRSPTACKLVRWPGHRRAVH